MEQSVAILFNMKSLLVFALKRKMLHYHSVQTIHPPTFSYSFLSTYHSDGNRTESWEEILLYTYVNHG